MRILCKSGKEYEDKIRKIGIIQSFEQCTFVIDDITLQTQSFIENKAIQIYILNFNLTFLDESQTPLREQTITQAKLKKIIKNPTELTNLDNELATTQNNLDKNYQYPLLTYKHLIYVSISSAIIILTILYIIRKTNKKPQKPPIMIFPTTSEQRQTTRSRFEMNIPRVPSIACRQLEKE